MLEAGKNGQCHDDASKEVTAPTGVAVVRFMQGFRPGPAVDPNAHEHAARSRLDLTADERRARMPSAQQEALTTVSPPPKQGLDGEDPARRRLAGRRHHQGAEQPVLTTVSRPRLPVATAQIHWPAQAHLGRARSELLAAATGAPPPWGGRASTIAAGPRSPLGSRRTTLPNRRRAMRRHCRQERTPPPCGEGPAATVAARALPGGTSGGGGREGTRDGGPEAGGVVAPRVA